MPKDDSYITVKILRRVAYYIIDLLRGSSSQPHHQASTLNPDSDKARELRQQGDDMCQVAADIEAEMHKRE